jgi:hypothetical protein
MAITEYIWNVDRAILNNVDRAILNNVDRAILNSADRAILNNADRAILNNVDRAILNSVDRAILNNVDRAILNRVFENTVRHVNKCLDTGRGHFEHYMLLYVLKPSGAHRLLDYSEYTNTDIATCPWPTHRNQITVSTGLSFFLISSETP